MVNFLGCFLLGLFFQTASSKVSGMLTNTHVNPVQIQSGKLNYKSDSIPCPIYHDPYYHGSADPDIVWNAYEKEWWIFYHVEPYRNYNIKYPEVKPKDKKIFLQIAELNDGDGKPYTDRSKRIVLPNLPVPDNIYRGQGK
jgi:hypothetical protein